MREKFEAFAQIVRLLDTIEAPGFQEHLSRTVPTRARLSGRPCKCTDNEPESAIAGKEGAPAEVGNHQAGASTFPQVGFGW